MAAGNPDELSERDFSYPGHKPTTREAGIIMMVDAIEAAARTVDIPEKTAFQSLVQQIVFSKLSQGQLDEAGLSLADLRVVVNTLVDALVNMYHARIKYPWQQTGDTGKTTIIESEQTVEPASKQANQNAHTSGTQPEPPNAPEPSRAPIPAQQPIPTPVPASQPLQTPIPMEQPTPTPIPVDEPSPTPVPADQPLQTPIPMEQPTPTPAPVRQPLKTSQATTKPPEPIIKKPAPPVQVTKPVVPIDSPKPAAAEEEPIVPIRKAESTEVDSPAVASETPDRQRDGNMTVPMVTPQETEKKEE
jgi:hypothetical protein